MAFCNRFGYWFVFRCSVWLLIQQLATDAEEERQRKEYTLGFKSEVQQAIGLLESRKLQLLPDDWWKASLSSGAIAVFPSDQREELRQAYFSIAKCNYEAIRTRDLGERFRSESDSGKREQILKEWIATSQQALGMGESTLSYLRTLVGKEWLS